MKYRSSLASLASGDASARPECYESPPFARVESDPRRASDALEEGVLDADELDVEPDWWDEGADDED